MSAVLEEAPPAIKDLSVTLPVTDDLRTALEASRRAPGLLIVIDSALMAQEASDELQRSGQRKKKLEALYKGFIEPANKIIEHARGLFKPAIEAEDRLQLGLKQGLGDWQRLEDARVARERAEREEAERKARQEAERKAAEELAKSQELARQKEEKARAEAEARAKAESEAREAAERARKAKEDGDAEAARKAAEEQRQADARARAAAEAEARALEQAQQATENGAASATKAHMAASAMTSTTPAPVAAAKVAGFTMRDNWQGQLEQGKTEEDAKLLLVKAIAGGRTDLLGLLIVDTSAINKMAKGLKSHMSVPGYVAVNDQKPVAARR